MDKADVAIAMPDAVAFIRDLYVAIGVPGDEAHLVADTLVQSEARGVRSHGLLRVVPYARRFQAGKTLSPCPMRVERETASTLLIDGGLGWGQVIGVRTMERCIAKAREAGSCLAAVRNANHFGAGAYYALLASRSGMIGIALAASGEAGDGVCVAPWGGYQPLLDTNPIAVAMPGSETPGISLDMATTTVAQGRLRLYEQRHEPIPIGWALDRDGNDTTDPTAGLAGTMLPLGGSLGGHKGYGLGLVVDVLCRLLPGSLYPHTPNDGMFIGAIDIAAFIPPEAFSGGIDRMAQEISQGPTRPGFDEILVPGERAARNQAHATAHGLTVARQTWDGLLDLADESSVMPPKS